MKILFSTNGQIRDVLGEESLVIELPVNGGLNDILTAVSGRLDLSAQNFLVNEENQLQPGLMVIVNDEMVFEDECFIKDGDQVSILMPMSGG